MWLLLPFILIPLIEIALFIQVGGLLTLWPTLGVVLLTAVIGTALVRWQGLRVLEDLRQEQAALRDPLSPLAHGAMLLIAGVLLLMPGFFTDTIGFLLLIPPLRRLIIARIASRVRIFPGGGPGGSTGRRPRDGGIIDGEWEDVTPEGRGGPRLPPDVPAPRRPGQRPSGWTEH
ncbi:FxsA family protein [Szabonella alba]|uniref:FxsA family protein n=1 Tax=Szabonella alba TaxID=2804194 RepID=A0A8K0Y039_9RHOB|nr:FxsA family protein [Szabonella alba]MBL4916698.1 FxsA family protein [Szabonella alba]